jgi:thioredoxin reductase (NADPH)
MKYDLVIAGAGPAGLTAGIYGARAGLNTIILERAMAGGLAATTDHIENFPGFPAGIKGSELTTNMKDQAQRFGVEIIGTEVLGLEKKDQTVIIKTSSRIFETKAMIIASGTVPTRLNVPGEDTLMGRGISFCATCDGPLFKGRKIAVIGCGNSGLQEGKFLLNFVEHITFVEFLPRITADKILQDRFHEESRAEFILNHKLLSIKGEQRVEAIEIEDRMNKTKRTIELSGIFVYIGTEPRSDFARGLVDIDRKGYIIANNMQATSCAGIFAAGDVCANVIRQVVTACGQGAVAAISAYHYIDALK